MGDPVISVENLGKKYLLGRQGEREQYVALRDLIAERCSSLGRSLFGRSSTPTPSSDAEFWALSDVSFQVKQGERIGIIGCNGAGKSTLLKVLSRITEPSTGRVRIRGRVASLLEVGTGFHPELTGRENIYLNGAILGMSRAEIKKKFDEIVDFAEIQKFLDTPVKRYSSGMYVRLAFAVAAHLDPEILVVDEVLAVGDAQFQRKCLGKMEQAGRDGRTVLFVSHNMGAVSRLCQRAILLQGGRVAQEGPAAEVVASYLQSDSNSDTRYSQPADPNLPLCLLEAEVFSGTGRGNTFSRQEPVTVRITYQVNRSIASVHIYSVIFNAVGTYVLGTGDADVEVERMITPRAPGTYVCEYQIPARTLNVGFYTVSISLGVPYQQSFQEPDNVVSFNIVDIDRSERFIHRDRAGVVWLDLPWRYLGESPFETGSRPKLQSQGAQ